MVSGQCSARLSRGLRLLAQVRSPKTNHNRIGAAFCPRRKIQTFSRQKEFDVEDIPSNVDRERTEPGQLEHTGSEQPEANDADATVRLRIRRFDEVVQAGILKTLDPLLLRDSCPCELCVDPSTKQKTFQTTDIPQNIMVKSSSTQEDGTLRITWQNDIPGISSEHETILTSDFFKMKARHTAGSTTPYEILKLRVWNKAKIEKELQYVNYDEYMNTPEGLYLALRQLLYYGLLLIREVPESEESVKKIAERIGNLRDSFYGRTWDVKSVPQAKNVAYTSKYLGLHMDLLYMANPPGFQFLHCLENTCEGGASLFSDSFMAAQALNKSQWHSLIKTNIPYHYRNAGKHYYHHHAVLEPRGYPLRGLLHVNYSPPFQADLGGVSQFGLQDPAAKPRPFLQALRRFAAAAESKDNVFEYRLQVGECVVFNNRRILHGRRQFDTSDGERWLKGAYIDTDVFMSRWRVMKEKWVNKEFQAGIDDMKLVSGGGVRDLFLQHDEESGSHIQREETLENLASYEKAFS